MIKIILKKFWLEYFKHCKEANKLNAKGYRLVKRGQIIFNKYKGSKPVNQHLLSIEGYGIQSQGFQLRAEANSLYKKGCEIYTNVVIDYFGVNAVIFWSDGTILSNYRTPIPLNEFY